MFNPPLSSAIRSALGMAFFAMVIFVLTTMLTNCNRQVGNVVETPDEPPLAKNVILMIGDGMGLGQISAGMYAYGNQTVLEEFPIVGLHKAYAYDKLITDSAAGATAFACGVKTYNGAVGVTPDTLPARTILEEASEKGLATGLVATSTIVHATPASFVAHNKSRQNYEEIAEDFLKTDIDIFIGGGQKYFSRREKDERNLVEELEEKGYVVKDYFNHELDSIKVDSQTNFAFFTADDDPLPAFQGRDYMQKAVDLTCNFISNHDPDGFFLMIEGSQIDWGGHANNSEYIITEFADFDLTLRIVMDFVKRDKNTLLVVTADHETGGYAIQPESKMGSIRGAFTSTYHTGTMVPVFAYGPGAELFAGIYENTEIYHKMRKAMGWNPLEVE